MIYKPKLGDRRRTCRPTGSNFLSFRRLSCRDRPRVTASTRGRPTPMQQRPTRDHEFDINPDDRYYGHYEQVPRTWTLLLGANQVTAINPENRECPFLDTLCLRSANPWRCFDSTVISHSRLSYRQMKLFFLVCIGVPDDATTPRTVVGILFRKEKRLRNNNRDSRTIPIQPPTHTHTHTRAHGEGEREGHFLCTTGHNRRVPWTQSGPLSRSVVCPPPTEKKGNAHNTGMDGMHDVSPGRHTGGQTEPASASSPSVSGLVRFITIWMTPGP